MKNAMSTTTATTKLKSNLNSVSNGCSSSLAALKQHITTCLQRWRQKHLSTKRNRYQCQEEDEHKKITAHSNENCYCHCARLNNTNRWSSSRTNDKEYSFIKFLPKFDTIQSKTAGKDSNSTTYSIKTGPRKYGRKVQIVAKLLSATLIAKATTKKEDCVCFEEHFRIVPNVAAATPTSSTTSSCSISDAMTITELTFLEIRHEYPDLDSEIRSILTARAQDGATIAEIRDDYRKLTGTHFPIYEDVTEFLLTIPHVTAYCSEKGTRIFNIKPMEKTKHIHDMVMQQKPQTECIQRPMVGGEHRNYYRQRERNSNYYPYTGGYNNSSRRMRLSSENIFAEPNARVHGEQDKTFLTTTDNIVFTDGGTEGFIGNNCYYQDNYNYLFKRICNQRCPLPPINQLLTNTHIEQQVVQDTLETQAPLPSLPSSNQLLTNTHIEQQVVENSHNTQAPLAPLVAGSSMAINNFTTDIGTYKDNIEHLNNLFRLQQLQPCELNENNLQTDVRRFSINPLQNIMPRSSRSSSPTGKSCQTTDTAFTDSDYEAHLLDFLLLGDDFFLYMARMELKCKFKKNQRILQSGLCVSGQTIGASIKRIQAFGDNQRSIILNIGSVDIMQGRQLIQIEHDFRELVWTMLKKGIRPILTTLAPLANYSHNYDIKRKLERFNDFIKREGQRKNLIVIDIWKCLVNERGYVLFDCYQNEPRTVTGTSEPYLFWNKIGRQRVLQLIESNLEY